MLCFLCVCVVVVVVVAACEGVCCAVDVVSESARRRCGGRRALVLFPKTVKFQKMNKNFNIFT